MMKMAKPLFNKDIPPACEYCIHGRPSKYNDEVFCPKRGVTNRRDSCRKYKYDVLKRKPNVLKAADGYAPEDFEL